MFSATVLTVAVSGMAGAMVSAMQLNRVNNETTLAQQAARQVLEQVQSQEFTDVFALYNADGADDPAGANTAPGPDFTVNALTPQDDDADGMVGTIVFPTLLDILGSEELREDVVDANLNMPGDLNADGRIDGADHSGDYQLLPVRVRVQWRGVTGPRTYDLETVLSAR